MPPRTKKHTSDLESSIRPTPCREKASPSRSRSVRPPSSRSARFRQSTLTQIVPEVSFLSRGTAAEDSEEEDEEQARRPVKRRRRRIGPSQKTLTQIGWINPLVIPFDDEEEEDEKGEGDATVEEEGFESEVLPSDDDEYDQVVAEEEDEDQDNAEMEFYGFSDDGEIIEETGGEIYGSSFDGGKASPQTPRRRRPREIPSSQTPPITPLTPWSVLRKRAKYNDRSPLKSVSTNSKEVLDKTTRRDYARMPPPKHPSPLERRSVRIVSETTTVKASALFSERSHVSDSQDLSDAEEEDLQSTSPKGVAIGKETQAMIHQIDAAYRPDLSWERAPQKDSPCPSSSQANRSFNFDGEDDADAAPQADETPLPSPSRRTKYPVLGGNVDEDSEEEEENELPTASFPTLRVPLNTQPRNQTQNELRSSQIFALQHPSQVSTVAETTQATPPRATPKQRNKSCSQQNTQTQQRTVPSASQGRTSRMMTMMTDDATQSQIKKSQSQHDRIPESPLRPSAHHSSSPTAYSDTHDRRSQLRHRQPSSSPAHVPSSSFPQPPPHLLSSSPVSSPVQRAPATNSRRHGTEREGDSNSNRVISATQMLPASLMEDSLARPPAGWDVESVGWVMSSMPEEAEE